MNLIMSIVSAVPTPVWIVLAVVMIFPAALSIVKKAGKLVIAACVVLALLFIFPSIGSSFMTEAQLEWDSESKTLTNRDGKSVSFKEALEKGEELKEKAEIAIQEEISVDDLLAELENESSIEIHKSSEKERIVEPEENKEQVVGTSGIVIDEDFIKKASEIGLLVTPEMVLDKDSDGEYWLAYGDTRIRITANNVKKLGLE